MANQSAKLTAYLYANIGSFETGMKKAGSLLGSFTKSLTGLSGQLTALIGSGGLVALSASALRAAGDIKDASDRLGLSAEDFQKYSFGARLAGVEAEKFETAIGALNNRLAKGELPYRSTGEALAALADRVKGAKTPLEQVAIVSDAFGSKLGRFMIPLLSQGSQGMKEMGAQAESLGLVMREDLVQSAEAVGDKIAIVGDIIRTNFQAGLLSEFVDESGQLADNFTNPLFAKGVRDIGAAFGSLVGYVGSAVTLFKQASVGIASLMVNIAALKSGASLEQVDEMLLKLRDYQEKLNLPLASANTAETPKQGGQAIFQPDVKKTKANNDALAKQKQLESELKRIYEETRTPLEKYNANMARLAELRTKLGEDTYARAIKKEMEELKSQSEEVDNIGRELGLTFTSAFEDAVVEGKKLRDVLGGIAGDLYRMFLRRTVTEPLLKGAEGLFSGGGSGGGLLSGLGNIFKGILPSFDTGISNVPRDMVAQIHKGEAVLRPEQAAAWRNGGGGNNYYFDARGADRAAVMRLEQIVVSQLGPGAIEHRMTQANLRGAV